MVSYERAKTIILNKYSDSRVTGACKIPTGYIFSLKPKSWKDDEQVLDGIFKVSSEDGRISEYSPTMDPDEFGEALKNRIE